MENLQLKDFGDKAVEQTKKLHIHAWNYLKKGIDLLITATFATLILYALALIGVHFPTQACPAGFSCSSSVTSITPQTSVNHTNITNNTGGRYG